MEISVPVLPELRIFRRSSLSPVRDSLSKTQEDKRFASPNRVYVGKESSVKLPFINRNQNQGFLKASPVFKTSKAKSCMKRYYDVSRIQRENNALRDFIHNFHLKQEGNDVKSSLDVLTSGTTQTIAGKVQKYFSQLEEYITKL